MTVTIPFLRGSSTVMRPGMAAVTAQPSVQKPMCWTRILCWRLTWTSFKDAEGFRPQGEIYALRVERRNNPSAHKAHSLPVAEIWRNYLLFLEVPFLDPRDEEASLKSSQYRLGKGEMTYKGLLLSIRNNADLLYIYKMC
jgi:hypothetical protein